MGQEKLPERTERNPAGLPLESPLSLTSDIADADNNRFVGLFPEKIKTVALVAPASPSTSVEALDLGIRLLKEAGIKVKVMPHAREGEPAVYTSIAAEKRIADLEQAWMDPEVNLIFCIRGGVGSQDLLDRLDWEKLRTRPDMPLLGFSNITALECAMLKEKAGHPYAAPSLLAILGVDQASIRSMRAMLAGETPEPVPLKALRPGKASGIALAGHLTLLETVNDTKFRPDTAEKVVFIECPDRKPDVVSSSLDKLRDSGFFEHCSGVVFGRLTGCGDEEETVMRNFAAAVKCPVFARFPYGHTPKNHTIDLRRKVTVDGDGLLRFE